MENIFAKKESSFFSFSTREGSSNNILPTFTNSNQSTLNPASLNPANLVPGFTEVVGNFDMVWKNATFSLKLYLTCWRNRLVPNAVLSCRSNRSFNILDLRFKASFKNFISYYLAHHRLHHMCSIWLCFILHSNPLHMHFSMIPYNPLN